MNRCILIVFSILFLTSCSVHSQHENQKLDKYFAEHYEKAKIVGLQVASVGAGELVWQGSYGVKEYKTSNEVNDSTLFMMASCSKPVTALGIMKLYDKGKFKLDDNINDYLPFKIENPNFPDKLITFRMLLSHTSSLRDNWDVLEPLYTLPEGGDSPLELQYFVKEYYTKGGFYYYSDDNFANEQPGSHFAYCNMGYSLLGALIEEISGKSFSQYMQEEVFLPLNMKDSYWFLNEIAHNNIANAHEILPEVEPEVLNHYGYPSFPDGQLRTTAADYAQILKLMINKGRLGDHAFLNEKTVEEFLAIQYPEVAKYQAIAWNYNEFDAFIYKLFSPGYLFSKKLPAHSGYDPGVETYVVFDPDKKTGAIIFINSPIIQWKGARIYHQMIRKLLREGKKTASS